MKILPSARRLSKGFTLVEILTVITIIALLAAIGFGGFRVAINKSNARNTVARITALQSNLEGYKNDAGEYPDPMNRDSTATVKGKNYISGGAEMLYQVMSGDGNNAIKGGTDASTGTPGSAGKVYWEDIVPPTENEIKDKKSKPYVGTSDGGAFYLIDGWRKPFRYLKAIKTRNKITANQDEMHSDGDYEIWSYGVLTEPLEDEESQKEWITSWGTNWGPEVLTEGDSLIGTAARPLFPPGLWWGGAAALTVCVLAVVIRRCGFFRQPAVFPDGRAPSASARKWTLLFAVAAMAVAVAPRRECSAHSLWQGEEKGLREKVWGYYDPQPDGMLDFHSVPWREALSGGGPGWYPGPVMEARAGHWLSGHDWSPGSTFSEPALRTLPWLGGILTVGLVVMLGGALGHPRAGLAAGLILALHPGHVHESGVLGGGSSMLLGAVAGLLCLLQALRTNHWRWWLGLMLAQALCLLESQQGFWAVAALNAMALCGIGFSSAPTSVRAGASCRLLAAGGLSLLPALCLMGLGVFSGAVAVDAGDPGRVSLGGFEALRDFWEWLAAGAPWLERNPDSGMAPSIRNLMELSPWRGWMIMGGMPVAAATGLFFLLRQDWRTRLVAGTFLLTGMPWAVLWVTGKTPLDPTAWSVAPLPGLVLAVAWAGTGLAAGLRLGTRAMASLPLLLAALCAIATQPVLARIIRFPLQPMRETVQAMRGMAPALTSADPVVLTASFGRSAQELQSYDPRLRILTSPAELDALTALAAEERRPLYLCLRDRENLAMEEPALLNRLTDSPEWRRLPDLPGREARFSYELYRYAPAEMQRLRLTR